MSATALLHTARGAAPSRSIGYPAAIGLIALVQAGWFGYLASRGWFYGDDLSYLGAATGQSLNWTYLSAPVNDHFVPGLRLLFWLMSHTTGLNYDITIIVRMALQAVATVLLYRLLALLAGRRPGVLLLTGWYAFGTLLLPGSLWLTTAVDLLCSQLLVILAIDLHVRYTVTGRIRLAVGSALALLGALSFWELSGITALLLPILSVGFLHSGTVGQRLRACLRRWPGWLVLTAALAGWLGYFVAGPYGGAAHRLAFGSALHVLRTGWLDALGPAVLGGPWRWFYRGEVYFPIADPPLAAVLLGQACILAAVLMAWRRSGARSLLAWSLPVLTFLISTLVVALGRFQVFGDLTPRSFNYAFPVAVPLAVAAALALLPSTPAEVAARAADRGQDGLPSAADGLPSAASAPRRARIALAALATLFLVSSGLSGATFSHRWAQNPSEAYVDRLTSSVRAAGPEVNLWDSRVPPAVLAFFSEHNHISDLLRLAQLPAKFQDPQTPPMLVKDDGSLAPAALFPVATQIGSVKGSCTRLVQGQGSWTIPLSKRLGANEYFVQVSYAQPKASVLYLAIRDQTSKIVEPGGGQRRELPHQLANLYLRLPMTTAESLVVRSEGLDTNVCIGAIVVGVPYALGGK
ncbi:MAG TPA: hypothetical protein VGB75_18995 [Jatrophihabitans sp.]|jgi:hypothetical protein|uniref:hypothetical protein n=1 Tax=Jatrophihabitans sp. TaxID=1932789 RepID=UPI002EE7A065